MYAEFNRIPDPNDPDSSFVQRLKNGAIETLKETVTNTGEIIDPANENVTIETITITRRIGEKIQF